MARPQSFNNAHPAGPQFASPYEAFRAGNSYKKYYRKVRRLEPGSVALLFYEKYDPIYAEITKLEDTDKSYITFVTLKSRTNDPPIERKLDITKRGVDWEFMEESADFPIEDGYRPIRKDDVGKNTLLMIRTGNTFVEGKTRFYKYENDIDTYTFKYMENGKERRMRKFGGDRKFDWEALTEITYTAPLTLTPFNEQFGRALRNAGSGGAGEAGAGGGPARKSKKNRKTRKSKTRRS
jgi:hypothetical protein